MDDQNSQANHLPASPPAENPVPQTVTPPPSKSFLSTKIILLIVILLILFGGGGTYLALNSKPKIASVVSKTTPTSVPTSAPSLTPDPTDSWKKYNGHGFEFKYPSDYEQGEVGDFVTLNKGPKPQQGSVISPEGVIFTFSKFDDNTGVSSLDDLKKSFPYDTVEDISMGENKIYEIIPSSNSGIPPHDFFIIKGKQTARAGHGIGIKVDEETKKESLKQFNQILSTFRFD